MKKLILISAALLLISCGAKPKSTQEFMYGSRLYNQFQENYLKGEAKLADYNFYKSEEQFMKVDSLCNLSRIYIGRYVIDETGSDSASMELAKRYAEVGGCQEELAAVGYLTGNKYDKSLLPEPYKTINGLDTEELLYAAKYDKFDDITKTRLLRKAAIDYIMLKPELSEQIAMQAAEIDKARGWTVNILRDLIITKIARKKQNKDIRHIETRIELLKSQLIKK